MNLADSLNKGGQSLSFEIFPPKGDLSIRELSDILSKLCALTPDFISVTYSAGGSGNSDKTATVASMVQNTYNTAAVAHLTCINSDKSEIEQMIQKFKSEGLENVLALRGDSTGESQGEFSHASELIPLLKDNGFCVGAACYAEGHISCDNPQKDWDYVLTKQDAGADFFVSQLFFDNDCFYRFLDHVRKIGVTKPIIPGVMPILSRSQITRMIFMCGASLPSSVVRLLNKYADNADDLKKAGIEMASNQVIDLLEHGVDGVHLYTMNQPDIAEYQTDRIRSR